jgi:hypothetical protein
VTAIPAGRGRSRGPADGLVRSAARGAILIGLAVLVGIILLNVVDQGSGGSGGGGAPTPTAPSTTDTTTSTDTTGAAGTTLTSSGATTTTRKGAGRPPDQVRVAVLNGSEVNGAATIKSSELRALGYVVSVTDNTATQTGTTVACRDGFANEQKTLISKLANSKAGTLPATLPVDTDCVVVIGK